jgi:hypothetical protein
MSTRKFCLSVENWMDDESEILALLKFTLVYMGGFILIVALLLSLATSLAGFLGDNKIVLEESKWHCTKTETIMVPVFVGKVIISQPREVCTTWEMNHE